ncbi:MAG: bifunctional oligoribonuclease/PAP phosphatase NrnA [Clostridia bacterium]|nr:bifunctional oligoribonuclease/PAP phosphatase NrnA [Clostridia bacterium]
MKNDAVAFLRAHDSYLLIAHVSPDGDTLGSCLALQKLLRQQGKAAWVVCDDPMPHLYAFLPGADEVLVGDAAADAQAYVAVDCANAARAGRPWQRAEGKPTLCIDHHITNPGYAQVNYIEDCAATGELIAILYEAFEEPISSDAGVCLYTAIATDTGNFAYSSVTSRTFALMGRVMESGFDLPECNRLLYRNERLQKLRMTARTVENAKLYRDEQVIVGTLSKAEMDAVNGLDADADGIIDRLRDVETVVAACFLREAGTGEVKLSLRSKAKIDCAALAKKYGGGGHVRAAGATLNMSLEQAEAQVTKALLAAFDEA